MKFLLTTVAALLPFAAAFSPILSRHGNNEVARVVLAMSSEAPAAAPIPIKEDVNTYIKCSKCNAAFQMKKEDLGNGRGRRVTCGVCDHSWYQANDKLFKLNERSEFVQYPDNEISSVKQALDSGQRDNNEVFTGESKLYVGNLSYDVTEQDLVWLFSQEAGDVGSASIVCDRETGRSRGFAFITMNTEEGGNKGCEMDGMEAYGRNIQVRRPNNN